MTPEQNERLTRVGPGTPAGALLRQYWQPVALSDELLPERPVRPVQVMGQHLVLFRDESGRLGLIDRDCPHRGADLAYGRLEDGGIRCLFHGWLFDVNGQCLETPAEPEGSKLHQRVKAASYPVVEKSGIVFAYLGEGEPPAFPNFDCFVAPGTHTFAFKGYWDCNWLQALEVGIDPAHASYLHRFFEDEDTDASYGKQFRDASANSNIPITKVLREYDRPDIKVDPVEYGLRLTSLRKLGTEQTHVRVTNLVFPQAFIIPMSTEMTISQWHVPVNDEACYWYAIFTSFEKPVNKQQMRDQRLQLYTLPDYLPKVGRHNAYGYDAQEQRSKTYTGMGMDINVHDQWAVESQGKIQDRSREHLGSTDKAIVAYRRLLMQAIEAHEQGAAVPMRPDAALAAQLAGPPSVDGVGPADSWSDHWQALDKQRRQQSTWAKHTSLAEQ